MCGCTLNGILAAIPARSTNFCKPDTENGAPRSLTNMKGDSASRLSARNALISSPSNGCVLVCPPLALRRCRVPDANSTSDHCRPQSSEARRPCRLSPPVARRLSQGRRCASVACLLPCGNARCRYSKPEHGKGTIILQATTASDWTFLVIRRQDFDDSCHLLASRRLLEH